MTSDDLDLPQGGRFVGRLHHYPARVQFEDTDLSGVVYHANYLRFMERARSDMLRLTGIDQRGTFEGGEGVYAVSELSIRFRRPARLDDALLVVSAVRQVRAASCRIHQSVMRADDLLSEAEVVAAFLTLDGRPRRQPRAWVEAFERLL